MHTVIVIAAQQDNTENATERLIATSLHWYVAAGVVTDTHAHTLTHTERLLHPSCMHRELINTRQTTNNNCTLTYQVWLMRD